ncbi:MAG TPA: 3-hydroxyacyl-CoA dehydrogenase family protein [Chitinophagaceae bacterium]|nr:3-hydroxyacyl-CoA dehydrogenase family protein [Chitinophagaceae bacterium]
MKLAILAKEPVKQEWLMKPVGQAGVQWVEDIDALASAQADAYFHLGFEEDPASIRKLVRITGPVFINSVIEPLIDSELLAAAQENCQLIRINAWPTFLKRELVECCIADPFDETTVKEVFAALDWKYRIVPDVPGMISPRIIAMIINEAYYTLQAGVSTKEEIDTAMKLGTNYPFGPFEWSEKIGPQRVHALLQALSRTDARYQPAENMEL